MQIKSGDFLRKSKTRVFRRRLVNGQKRRSPKNVFVTKESLFELVSEKQEGVLL